MTRIQVTPFLDATAVQRTLLFGFHRLERNSCFPGECRDCWRGSDRDNGSHARSRPSVMVSR